MGEVCRNCKWFSAYRDFSGKGDCAKNDSIFGMVYASGHCTMWEAKQEKSKEEKCCGNCYFFKDETADGFGKCDVTVGFQSCEHCCDKWQAKEDEVDEDIHIKPKFKDVKKVKIVLDDDINNPKHYTQGKIEPIDYILANKLDFLEGNIVKYVTRYKYKNGVEDLKKAEFYFKKLIDREEEK
jgi:hypothetical protein